MTNPWIKGNPLLSLWLGAASTAAAQQRSAYTAEIGQRQAALMQEWVRLWTEAWQAWLPGERR
jgi:hypothetical protein